MLRKDEFLTEPKTFEYIDVNSEWLKLKLEPESLGFTYCQIPIVYKLADHSGLDVIMKNGYISNSPNLTLEIDFSQSIFGRTGEISQIIVHLDRNAFK